MSVTVKATSLEQLHLQLRRCLKDLTLSYDFTKKEKVIQNTVSLLEQYLSGQHPPKKTKRVQNKENVPPNRRQSPKVLQPRSLMQIKQEYIGAKVGVKKEKSILKQFSSRQSSQENKQSFQKFTDFYNQQSRHEPIMAQSQQMPSYGVPSKVNTNFHTFSYAQMESQPVNESSHDPMENLEFNISQQSFNNDDKQPYRSTYDSSCSHLDHLKIKNIPQLENKIIAPKRHFDMLSVLTKDQVLSRVVRFLDETTVEQMQVLNKGLAKQVVQIRVMQNSQQLYHSVSRKEECVPPFVLEPNLEKIAKEVAVKTFAKDSEQEIQRLLQMSMSEQMLKQVEANQTVYKMVVVLYIMMNRIKELKINLQTKEILLQNYSLVTQPLGLILQNILNEFECKEKQEKILDMFYDQALVENIRKSLYLSRKISPVLLFIHKLIIKVLNHFGQGQHLAVSIQKKQQQLLRLQNVVYAL